MHERQRCGNAVQDPANVHIDHPIPLIYLERFEFRKQHDAGIVDQHVDASVQFDSEVYKGLHVIQVGDIQRQDISDTAC
ncbi:hypothetical protein D3C78_1833200 [compost metagenome]